MKKDVCCGGVRKDLRPDEAEKTDDNELKILVTKREESIPIPFDAGEVLRVTEELRGLMLARFCLQSVAETGAHMTRYANSIIINTYISQ